MKSTFNFFSSTVTKAVDSDNYNIVLHPQQGVHISIAHNESIQISKQNLKDLEITISELNMGDKDKSLGWVSAFNLSAHSIDHIQSGGYLAHGCISFQGASEVQAYDIFLEVKGDAEKLPILREIIEKDLHALRDHIKTEITQISKEDWFTYGLIASVVVLLGLAVFTGGKNKEEQPQSATSTPTAVVSSPATESFENLALSNGGNLPPQAHQGSQSGSMASQPSAIMTAQDMTPENLHQHNQNITDEVRRQVLADMGIDLDNLETLNNCVIE